MDVLNRGLIPGPTESEEHFWTRVEKAKPQRYDDAETAEALERTQKLFGVKPDWVPVFYANKGLSSWEGGATWVDDDQIPIIQLRYIFQRKNRYFGMYDKVELLAHEFLHAARATFDEPQYEEFMAYKTGNAFRAFLGSFVQSPKEVTYFLISLLIFCVAIFFEQYIFALAPFLLLGVAFVRTLMLYYRWNKCLRALKPSFLFCLADAEIHLFSKMSLEQIQAYVKERAETSFRWKLLRTIL